MLEQWNCCNCQCNVSVQILVQLEDRKIYGKRYITVLLYFNKLYIIPIYRVLWTGVPYLRSAVWSCCCELWSSQVRRHACDVHKHLCQAISITVSDQLHMPLIIIAGYPCCGKSTFCVRLASYLEAQGVKKVIIINEETENINKRSAYLESSAEKKTRGSLKSAVDHVLDAESFVILDSMNYIKGYRYELFCISRSLRTPHCCIWVESDEDSATKWNNLRTQTNVNGGYDAETYVASSKIQSFIHFIS